jgi:hypothetical protein
MRRYVFVDEFGLNLAMARRYGRAHRGQRVVGRAPVNYGENMTLVLGLRLDGGALAPLLLPGPMDGNIWREYVTRCLAPCLRPGDIVVFDGLGAHREPNAAAAIAARGARTDPLPPYSPDLSPVEQCGSKVKGLIRGEEARSFRKLTAAAGRAIRSVTSSDAAGWFQHSGYSLLPKVKPL